MYEQVEKAGLQPNMYVMDNECSKELKDTIRRVKSNINWYCHIFIVQMTQREL